MYGMAVQQAQRVNRDHLTGFVVGVGVAAAGYYVYMKNKDKVDALLSGYGIKIPAQKSEDLATLTLEELLLKKENLEDIIAEKEMKMEAPAVATE